MRVCFFGYSTMDFKGEEINEVVFLKEMIDELNKRNCECFYLYNDGGVGINDEVLFNKLDISATRLCIDKYSNFPYEFYNEFSEEEIYDIFEFNHKLQLLQQNRDNEEELKYTVFKVLENIKEYDENNNIDIFIFFGNSMYSNIIRAYCKKNNKKFFNMENGYFRPYTLMVDTEGVNYESSIPRDVEFYKDIDVDIDRYKNYLKSAEKAFKYKNTAYNLRKKYYDYFGINIDFKENITNSKEIIKNTNNESKYENYIYVPFQLETDSQIIKHSTNIKTMKKLVEVTLHAIEQYNEINNEDIHIIYKVHPLYKSEANIIDIEGIKEICSGKKNVSFLLEGDNKSLVENARAVITINSTVGFEAIQNYKPTIVLGDAFYGIQGISYTCKDISKLTDTLQDALLKGVNEDILTQFIYYLRFNYFVEIFRNYPDKDSIKRLVNVFLGVGVKNEQYSKQC